MTVSPEDEASVVEWLITHRTGHVTLPTGEDRILISRDGLRVYLHRHLYRRLIGDLSDREFLVRNCGMAGCQNPHHFTLTRRARPAATSCPNGHPYSVDDEQPDGSRRCSLCYQQRLARKRTGRPMYWQVEKARTHCPHGHPYEEGNLYIYGNRRKCKTCTILRAAGKDPSLSVD